MRAVVVWLIVALSMLVAQSAHASGLRDYAVKIDLREDHQRATYQIHMAYRANPGETKTEGYKFLGPSEVHSLRRVDSPGAHVATVRGFLESRVRMVLTLDDQGQPEPITFAYEQLLPDRKYTWGGFEYSMPWLDRFEIPVDHMTVELLVPQDWEVEGYECRDVRDYRRCIRSTDSAEPVHLEIDSGSRATTFLSLTGIMGLLIAAFVWVYRAGQRAWTSSLGFIPASESPQPPLLQQTYRAPAPIPVEPDLEAVLSSDDLERYRKRFWLIVALGGGGLLLLALVSSGTISIPLVILFAVMGVGVVALSHDVACRESGRMWLLTIPAAGAMGLWFTSSFAGLLGGLVVVPAAVALGMIVSSTSSGGSGSSCSAGFFSCGSGCGGGCGGCGGGCGGCGG